MDVAYPGLSLAIDRSEIPNDCIKPSASRTSNELAYKAVARDVSLVGVVSVEFGGPLSYEIAGAGMGAPTRKTVVVHPAHSAASAETARTVRKRVCLIDPP